MKTAVISLTKNGIAISEKIAAKMDCDRYAFEKYAAEGSAPFSSLSALTADIFRKYEGLVFICAVGIAVRAVAPHLKWTKGENLRFRSFPAMSAEQTSLRKK